MPSQFIGSTDRDGQPLGYLRDREQVLWNRVRVGPFPHDRRFGQHLGRQDTLHRRKFGNRGWQHLDRDLPDRLVERNQHFIQ